MGKKIESQSKKTGKKLGHGSKTKGRKLEKRLRRKEGRPKEYVGMKKEWPPLRKCPQYKYGMITRFMARSDCEDEYDSDEIKYYYHQGLSGPRLASYKPSDIKKFLHQVRSSRGYDVDVWPPSFMGSAFIPLENLKTTLQDHNLSRAMATITKKLMKHIKSKTGKVYKYVETLKLVYSTNRIFLLTFTAKEDADDAELETFLAAIFAPGSDFCNYNVLECFLKPDGPPPME